MKATVLAAGALIGGAAAHSHHAHHDFHKRQNNDTDVVCSYVVETITGDNFIWSPTPNAVPANQNFTSTISTTASQTTTISEAVTVTPPASTHVATLPTPAAQTCPTPGTYTYPASTVTITTTETGVVPATTACTPGVNTIGGVTTVVETATTIVCPYATVKTNTAGVVTSVIESTTYVCPAAGTYTINPTTTTLTAAQNVTVPSIATYPPGVYTAPAVTTVVETSTVVYCPFESSTAESTAEPTTTSSSSSSSSTSVAPPPASTTPASSSSSSVVPVVPSSAVPSSSASASSASSAAPSSSATHAAGALGQWAITYTPYNHDTGDCQTASQVESDLLAISLAGFSTIRLYSTDCDTLPNVGSSAASNGLRVIPGIYVSATGCTIDTEDIAEQVAAFKSWEHWDLVEFFAVGNEALANGFCSGSQLASLITAVKSELGSLYSGQWTTTDVVSAWQVEEAAAAVCAVVDFPSANVHSYFTSTVSPSDAGEFVKGQLEIVEQMCGGVSGYILESGYPTEGSTIGLNIPSIANQAIAIGSILDTIGDKTVLFSMYDDSWKSPGSYNCEQYWGIAPSLFGVVADAWEILASIV
ncbi:hypothetical protein N0V82_003611 [Gnomoniopsis sp. IMI 355080]|nr:hypothetical protein N0V82_003611 [Gnomoniopsis sp. IMI 355080]